MIKEEFHTLIDEHITHAKEKHPLFAHRLVDATMEYYDALANSAKLSVVVTARDGHCPATTVVLAEVYEFFNELAAGNLDRAKEEGADIVATIYRALEMLEEQKESNHE